MAEELLTSKNYFSQNANKMYMSVSQYKDFAECEVLAMAKLNGEYVEKKSKALLIGSYIDAYFSNELDEFKAENPQIFKKDGTLKNIKKVTVTIGDKTYKLTKKSYELSGVDEAAGTVKLKGKGNYTGTVIVEINK